MHARLDELRPLVHPVELGTLFHFLVRLGHRGDEQINQHDDRHEVEEEDEREDDAGGVFVADLCKQWRG